MSEETAFEHINYVALIGSEFLSPEVESPADINLYH